MSVCLSFLSTGISVAVFSVYLCVCPPSVHLSFWPTVNPSISLVYSYPHPSISFPSISLSVHPSVHLSFCPSTSLFICLYVHLSLCPSTSLFICLCVHLSLSVHLCPSGSMSVCLSLSIWLYVHPYHFPSVFVSIPLSVRGDKDLKGPSLLLAYLPPCLSQHLIRALSALPRPNPCVGARS